MIATAATFLTKKLRSVRHRRIPNITIPEINGTLMPDITRKAIPLTIWFLSLKDFCIVLIDMSARSGFDSA
jgi:hypothetical protein